MSRIIFLTTALLLALLPFHAFLFTWFKSFFWTDSWTVVVQLWKEITLIALGSVAAFAAMKNEKLKIKKYLQTSLTLPPLAFLALAGLYLVFGDAEIMQRVFGFRQVALLLVAFLVGTLIVLSTREQAVLRRVLVLVTGVVALFGLALLFFLPHDFLARFGYSTVVSTWLPSGNLPMYHLVGGTDLIRAQASFAGPNQLGAWLLVLLPLVLHEAMRDTHRTRFVAWLVAALALTLFIFTYSRAAWLGMLAIGGLVSLRYAAPFFSGKKIVAALTVFALLFVGALTLLFSVESTRDLLVRHGSTSEHFEKTIDAAKRVAAHPLGLGLGSTAGGAQRYGDGLTPENDYLGIALELGWLGLALFLAWLVVLGTALWQQKNPLAASLAGVAVVMLFLHPLADSATAITLGLLAGLAVCREQT